MDSQRSVLPSVSWIWSTDDALGIFITVAHGCLCNTLVLILVKSVFERFAFNYSPTGIVPCPATPTTFGHIRTANSQGQQRRRITSIQPPTGLQEWLRTFQVSTASSYFSSPRGVGGVPRKPGAKPHPKADVAPNQCSLSLADNWSLVVLAHHITISTVAWNWN